MRHSLLVRLSVLTLSVTVVSVAATAWLATLILNRGIQQANGQSQAKIVTVYETLLQYGATHPDWAGVGPVVDALSRRTEQQIELTGASNQRLAFAQSVTETLPPGPAVAVVDPLHVDPSLDPSAPASRIDPTAARSLALSSSDLSEVDTVAGKALQCMEDVVSFGRAVADPSGRSKVLKTPVPAAAAACGVTPTAFSPEIQRPTASSLYQPTFRCLESYLQNSIAATGDRSWEPSAPGASAHQRTATQNCVDSVRRELLKSRVAPPAVLYLATLSGQQRALVFSPHNELRIAEVVAAVIALAIGATLLAGFRLVRPLRALTAAARGVEENGFTEVAEVSGNDEIAHLTRAFNHMARAQAQMEEQRKIAISDIAHELRTPLANMRAWLEAARDGLADNDTALARSLLEEAMLLQRTVDDLQLLAMADAGKLRLHLQDVPLAPLLKQARAALSGPAEAAGVTLNLACPDIVVVVDPDRLRQIVQNLVSNAIRHSHPAGSVDIMATVKGEFFRVDVIDHGTGIAATDLPWIYDRFWRAEKSRSRAAGGSGLGLAIVRQLVEAHGGTVDARSVPDKETVFSVLLPTPAYPDGRVQRADPPRRPSPHDERRTTARR